MSWFQDMGILDVEYSGGFFFYSQFFRLVGFRQDLWFWQCQVGVFRFFLGRKGYYFLFLCEKFQESILMVWFRLYDLFCLIIVDKVRRRSCDWFSLDYEFIFDAWGSVCFWQKGVQLFLCCFSQSFYFRFVEELDIRKGVVSSVLWLIYSFMGI